MKIMDTLKRKKHKEVLAWHVLRRDGRLNYNDRRKPQINVWMRAKNYDKSKRKPVTETKMCNVGMHASRNIADALTFFTIAGPGFSNPFYDAYICRVKIRKKIKENSDKLVGLERKIIWRIRIDKAMADELDYKFYNENMTYNELTEIAHRHIQRLRRLNDN